MPTHYSAVRIPLPESEILADLYGVEADLEHVVRTCEAAIKMSEVRQRDPELVESLVCAALIRYFRCFSRSPRLGLRHEEIGARNKALREAHAWFRALRDRFVAHCINPLEQVWVAAALAVRDGAAQPVASLTQGSHRVVLSAYEAESIRTLADHALAIVRKRCKPEYRRVLKLVQKLPLSTIHEWDARSHPRVQAKDVGLTRRQTRPNHSIDGTSTSKLRLLAAAPHVKR